MKVVSINFFYQIQTALKYKAKKKTFYSKKPLFIQLNN